MRPSAKAREVIEQIRVASEAEQVEALCSEVEVLEGDDEEHIRTAAEEKLEDLRSA